jgi:hypothetical protein
MRPFERHAFHSGLDLGMFAHPIVPTALLLTASNLFMTFAWYGHLKNLGSKRCGSRHF